MNDFKDYLNTVGQEQYETPSFLEEGLLDKIKKGVQNFKDKHDQDSEHTYYALKIDLSKGETIKKLVNDAAKKQADYKKSGTDKSLDDCAKESLTDLYEKLMQYVRESAENNKTIKKYIFAVQPKNTALYVWFTENNKTNRQKNIAARDLKLAIDAFQDPYRIDDESLLLVHDTFTKSAALDLKNNYGVPKDDAEIRTKVTDTRFQKPIETAIDKLSDKISEKQKELDDKELNGEEVEICYIAWPINKNVLKPVFNNAKSTDKPEKLYANYINNKLKKAKLIDSSWSGNTANRLNNTNGYYGLSYTKTGLRLYFKFTKQVKDIQSILTEEDTGINTKIITAKRPEKFLNGLDASIDPTDLTTMQVFTDVINPAFSAGRPVYRINVEMDNNSARDFRKLIIDKASIDDINADEVKNFIQDTLGDVANRYAANEFLGFAPSINTKTSDGAGMYMCFSSKDSRESVKEIVKGMLPKSRITTSESNYHLAALEALSKTVGKVEFDDLIEAIRNIAASGICNTKKYSVIKVTPNEDDIKQWIGKDITKIKDFNSSNLVNQVKELCDELKSTYLNKFCGMTFADDSIEFIFNIEKDTIESVASDIKTVFSDVKPSAESLSATKDSVTSWENNIKDETSIGKTLSLLVRDIISNRDDLAKDNAKVKTIAFKIIDKDGKLIDKLTYGKKEDLKRNDAITKIGSIIKSLIDKTGNSESSDYKGWTLNEDSIVLIFDKSLSDEQLKELASNGSAIAGEVGTVGETQLTDDLKKYLEDTKNITSFTDNSAITFIGNFLKHANDNIANNKDNSFDFIINFSDIAKMRYIDVTNAEGGMNDGILGIMASTNDNNVRDNYKPVGFGKYLSEYLYTKFNVNITENKANSESKFVTFDNKYDSFIDTVKSIGQNDHEYDASDADASKKQEAENHKISENEAEAVADYYMAQISKYIANATYCKYNSKGKVLSDYKAETINLGKFEMKVLTTDKETAEKLYNIIKDIAEAHKTKDGKYYFKVNGLNSSKK